MPGHGICCKEKLYAGDMVCENKNYMLYVMVIVIVHFDLGNKNCVLVQYVRGNKIYCVLGNNMCKVHRICL